MRLRAGSLALSLTAAATSLALLAPALGPADAAAGGPTYRRHDYADGQAMYVLPPGENGLVNATDALQFETTSSVRRTARTSCASTPTCSTALPRSPTRSSRSTSTTSRSGSGRRTSPAPRRPATGVTIYRDTHDVPHIYGDTDPTAAFGAGYAQAEDRLFMMDVLRHYGAGTLASFLGASCEFEQMDHDQLLLAPYTPAQAQAAGRRPAEAVRRATVRSPSR